MAASLPFTTVQSGLVTILWSFAPASAVSSDLYIQRFSQNYATTNAQMDHSQIREYCAINDEMGNLLQQAMEQLYLSARAYDRILKVARTMADLEKAKNIQPPHLMEAIQYRSLDRNLFY